MTIKLAGNIDRAFNYLFGVKIKIHSYSNLPKYSLLGK